MLKGSGTIYCLTRSFSLVWSRDESSFLDFEEICFWISSGIRLSSSSFGNV